MGIHNQYPMGFVDNNLLNMHVSKEMNTDKPCNLYVELSKAFDTLTFDILIHKLKYYGFSGS